MEGIDATMITTALPAIAADLKMDPIGLKVAVSAYYLAMAVFIPIGSWCADRFGARIMFCLSLAAFTLGSVACAFSYTFLMFVVARATQGAGAALMFPIGRVILLRTLPKNQYVGGLALLSIPAQVGPILGPVIGGFITTYFHWSWLFWINVPLGVGGIILTTRVISNDRLVELGPLDLTGFVLSAIGLAFLGSGLNDVVDSSVSVALAAIGLGFLILYMLHARSVSAPILDLKLFSFETFRICAVSGFVFRAGGAAFGFLLPVMLQVQFGLTALDSGMLTFSGAFGIIFAKVTIAPILRRVGFRRVLVGNALTSAVAVGMTGLLSSRTPLFVIVALVFCVGTLCALQIICLDTLAYANISDRIMNRASALISVLKQFAPAVGVASVGLLMQLCKLMPAYGYNDGFDVRLIFALILVPMAVTSLINARLPPSAGEDVSGHVMRNRRSKMARAGESDKVLAGETD